MLHRLTSKNWMASCEDYNNSQWVMVGVPFDTTCSGRPGTRFAPCAIRNISSNIETYSPYLDRDLEDINFYDAGELELPAGNKEKSLNIIQDTVEEVLNSNKKWLGIGGEHLITYPALCSYIKKYPDLCLIQFDAHADLRKDFFGEEKSHACVVSLASKFISPDNIVQIGIRSGTREEFKWIRENNTLLKNKSEIKTILEKFNKRPIFLTIDLDVLDPSIMCGTGTPEPGGFSFNEMIEWIIELKDSNIVGADIVELSPDYDSSGVSTITAAKVIREILLLN